VRATVAVVPLRDGRSGKTRLAQTLGADDRSRLVAALARHVVSTLASAGPVTRVVVVTADPEFAHAALADVVGDVEVLAQPADRSGLNAALDVARERLVATDPEARLLAVHADLPALTPDDVAALARVGGPLALAPDRAGSGTNALLLDRPGAAFTFAFGLDSLAAHRAEARRLGWAPVEVDRPGLAVDLDTLRDWAVLPEPVRARVVAAVPGMATLPVGV
jgi:2-phospho-L-lactate guanylyltransferase